MAQLAVAVVAACAWLTFVAPAPANAAPCLLFVICLPSPSPSPSPAPSPPPAAQPGPPLPPPPSPIPVTPGGPAIQAPPGNPGCSPRPGRRHRWAVGSGDVVSADPRDRRCTLATMAAAGVNVVRTSFLWSQMEPRPGQFDFDFYDRYVEQLARYRLRVLPVLFSTPRAYSAAPGAAHPGHAQPRRSRTLARFARAAARRWGPGGSFWRRHPRLPRLPVRSWQVWNEPNLSAYWSPRPDARRYAHLLAAAARSIRRFDPRAEIVLGGLPESGMGIPIARYLDELYRAGARRWFDAVALHPYARTASRTVAIVSRVREVVDAHRDRRARIWVTEFGWGSAGPRHRFRTGERGQAARVRKALSSLWRRRARLRLRGAIYSFWRDPPPSRIDWWGLHVGLYRRDGRPKPAAAAFRRAVRAMR